MIHYVYTSVAVSTGMLNEQADRMTNLGFVIDAEHVFMDDRGKMMVLTRWRNDEPAALAKTQPQPAVIPFPAPAPFTPLIYGAAGQDEKLVVWDGGDAS